MIFIFLYTIEKLCGSLGKG